MSDLDTQASVAKTRRSDGSVFSSSPLYPSDKCLMCDKKEFLLGGVHNEFSCRFNERSC